MTDIFCLVRKLAVIKLVVEAAALNERGVVALLNDIAVLHYEYYICLAHGGKSVRYDKARAALHHSAKGLLYLHLGTCVDGRGRLVKYEHWRQTKQNARDAQKLLLSLG